MKQNITLPIEKQLLKKTKLIAARKETSVTKLLAEQLAKIVSEDEQGGKRGSDLFIAVLGEYWSPQRLTALATD